MTSIAIKGEGPPGSLTAFFSPGDRAVLAIVAAYTCAVAGFLALSDTLEALAFHTYLVAWPFAFLLVFPSIYGLLVLLRIVHRVSSWRSRLMALRRSVSSRFMQPFATGLVLLTAMMLFQGAFTSIKTALPVWNGGFPHDILQADIDRAIHFGMDPWRYLMAVGEHDWLRAAVEWNYNQGWFIFCYGMLFFVTVSANTTAWRTRYLIAYMLAWIVIGNVVAGLALSAGPAFYGAITGDHSRFGDQLSFLARGADSVHSATTFQSYLWHLYQTGKAGFGSGISAFPSMHVGMATLNALFIAEVSRRWGYVAFAYALFILLSSVYLAWHYAIDGYVAIVITVAIYLATRRIDASAASPADFANPGSQPRR